MADNAGTWQRVSTGGQDEASQLPDLNNWCDAHGYEIKARYVLHGKSASKGKHDAALDQVIRDMEDGKINVLVVWQSSRLERRGVFSVFDFQRRVLDAGGRIEYVQDSHLNATNEMSDVMLSLAATMDKQKAQTISKQVRAKHNALRATGSAIGRPPWGFVIRCTVCDAAPQRPGCNSHVKVFAPTRVAFNWVPRIYQAVIDGASTRRIAEWLESEGVPTAEGRAWNEGFIGKLIKNPIYYGQRRNGGTIETEALVSATTWQEANAVIASRPRPGRGTTRREKVLFTPYCGACYGVVRDGCASGKSPMYRVAVNGGYTYYRCSGDGPQRKGCGAPYIPVSDLETVVTDAKASDLMPHYERVFIAGDTLSDEIAAIAQRGSDAMLRGDLTEAQACMATMAELRSQPRVAPHWESRETGMTEADYFASLTRDERREYLSRSEIIAEMCDGEPTVTMAPQWAVAS